MKYPAFLDTKEERSSFIKAIIATTVGSLISAFALNAFYIPHQILSSGVTGIGLLISYETGWNVSLITFALNIPLFVLAMRFIGWRAFWINLYGSAVFSVFIELFKNADKLLQLDVNSAGSQWTCLILGASIYGLGLGVMYRYGGGSGGIDILGVALNRLISMSMATWGIIFNTVLYIFYGVFYGLDSAAYSIGCMFLSSFVNSYVVDGIDRRRACMIISQKYHDISNQLMIKLHRGVTILDGHGAYTDVPHPVIYTVISPLQVEHLKRIVREIDPNAFLVISETSGVFGNGRGFHPMSDVRTDIDQKLVETTSKVSSK